MAPGKQSTTKRKHNANDTPLSTPAKRIKSSFTSPLKVLVDTGEDVFFVYEDVICASSAFFKAACSKAWKENQEKTVRLPTADPTAFHMYVDWLYNGDLDEDELQKCEEEPYIEDGPEKQSMKIAHNLCKLWILADYLQDFACKTRVIVDLLARGPGAYFNMMFITTDLVVAETSPTSALYRWMLDYLSLSFVVDTVQDYPPSFQLALLKNLGKLRDSGDKPTVPGSSDLDKYVDEP